MKIGGFRIGSRKPIESNFERVVEMLNSKELGKLLDIGGGPGIYLPLLKDSVNSYYLVDISYVIKMNAHNSIMFRLV